MEDARKKPNLKKRQEGLTTKARNQLAVVKNQKSNELDKVKSAANQFIEKLKANVNKNQMNNFETINMFLDKGYITENEVVNIFAKEFNCEVVSNLEDYKIPPEVLQLIPKQTCLKNLLLPLAKIEQTLVVVFHDPSNKHVIDNLSLVTGCKIQPVVASKSQIKQFLNNIFSNSEEAEKLLYDMEVDNFGFEDETVVDLDEESSRQSGDSVISFVNLIFSDAIRLNCSDIHVECYENAFRIRYRTDGMLKEVHTLPKDMSMVVISRIKVMSNMDISEKRRPQDARLKIRVQEKELNMRVSSTPTISGEKIVLRILDDSSLKTDMSQLGMEKKQMEMFTEAISKPQGLVLLTGPTGSGKTTTIYSGLMRLNTPDRNISTVEDPVEFRIHGINQVQINSKIGVDFSTILRAFLRQDPDVILVGEIRDIETAEISLKASSTGHMVLSTLHTNDTASTVTRLLGMGVPSYSLADNVSLIVSQRLLRCLCERCKVSMPEDVLQVFLKGGLKNLGITKEDLHLYENAKIFRKSEDGCSHCNDLGYKGRVAVYEMLILTPRVKAGIFENLSPAQLKKIAINDGMLTLRQSALNKLREGVTSVEEVIRTTVFD